MKYVVIIALVFLSVNVVAEESDLKLTASIRSRYEIRNDWKFNDSLAGNDEDYLLNQFRLGLDWAVDENFAVMLEGQEALMSGEDAVDDSATPNIYSDDFDLHQANITTNFDSGFVKAGRQKIKYGQERLLGSFEWSNTARAFDLLLVRLGESEKRSLDFFAGKPVSIDTNSFNDWSESNNRYADSELYGAYYTDKESLEDSVIEAYYLLRHASDFDDKVHTVGHRFENKYREDMIFDAEIAGQFGDFAGLDQRAWALHLANKWVFNKDKQASVNVAYNYASGDDDSTDSKHGTFDNLYPTNHMHYGYMDFLSWQNMHNIETSLSFMPADDFTLKLAWQNYWLAETADAWYGAGMGAIRPGAADASSYLGNEINLLLQYLMLDKKLAFEAGYGHFFSNGFIEDTGTSPDSDFVYLQTKISFSK